MATLAAPQAAAAKRRSLWWRIHAWAGLKLSIFLLFILATGTLATVAHEIDWMLRPALRVAPQPDVAPKWGAMLDSARAAISDDSAITSIAIGPEPFIASSATVMDARGRRSFVYLDPATGRVTGTGSWITAQRILRQVHRHLMIPTAIGVPIVSSLSILMLASLITGLVTYKRFWTGFFRKLRPARGDAMRDRRWMGDAHRLAGLWSIPLIVVMIATGLWYLVESLGGEAPRPAAEQAAKAALADAPMAPAITGAALDTMVGSALNTMPDLRITNIRLPQKAGDAVVISGQATAVLVRDRANAVYLDAASGRILASGRGEEMTVHQRIGEAADPLHFGTFGGLATKLLWFLLGILLSGLALSGVLITSLRLAMAERAEPVRLSVRAWAAMGAWRYAGVAAIVVAIVATPLALSGRF